MILSAHILTAAVVVSKVQNPVLGIFLAFLSHYLLDSIPHREYSAKNIFEKNWKKSLPDFLKVFLDGLIGFSIIFLITDNNFIIYLGGFMGILPDGIAFLALLFPRIKLLEIHQKFHHKLHENFHKRKIPVFWEIFSQIAVSLISIYFLLQ
jgi:hypothetical protein